MLGPQEAAGEATGEQRRGVLRGTASVRSSPKDFKSCVLCRPLSFWIFMNLHCTGPG